MAGDYSVHVFADGSSVIQEHDVTPSAPLDEMPDGIEDEPPAAGPTVEHARAAEVAGPAVSYLRPAGVTVRLAHPFTLGGRLVEEIALPPVALGIALDVQSGMHETILDVLAATTGEPLSLFRALRGGDEQAVIGTFVSTLPESIRALVEGAR